MQVFVHDLAGGAFTYALPTVAQLMRWRSTGASQISPWVSSTGQSWGGRVARYRRSRRAPAQSQRGRGVQHVRLDETVVVSDDPPSSPLRSMR
jgi:hypothetical protein